MLLSAQTPRRLLHCLCRASALCPKQSCTTSAWREPKRSGGTRRHPPLSRNRKVCSQTDAMASLWLVPRARLPLPCNLVRLLPDADSSDRESSLEQIKLDISRTFPNLCIFQQVSDRLHSIQSQLALELMGFFPTAVSTLCLCCWSGRAVPRCAAQHSGSVHLLPARRWLRKSYALNLPPSIDRRHSSCQTWQF